MGMMSYREANQVKWFGSRPGHNGGQLTEIVTAENGLQTITVPAGEQWFVCSVISSLNCWNAAGGDGYINLDRLAARMLNISRYRITAVGSGNHTVTFWPPVELIPGDNFKSFSSAAQFQVVLSLFGWME